PGTLEFAIHHLIETRIDMSPFEVKIRNDETGRPAYNPKVILKAVLLAYSRGIIGSRKIEQACKENVTFIAIIGWSTPDHSTIAEFISSMQEEIEFLFRNILLICDEMGLLGGTKFSLDGLKLSSNASEEWSGRKADLRKKKEKIEKWLLENEGKQGKRSKEIQSNITDNESAKMKTSHGVIQGYNCQALVDSKHQIIVHGEAFGSGQDTGHIGPMIEGAKENVKAIGQGENYFEGKIVIADSNYHSEDNFKKCNDEKINAYIPDVYFRKRDPQFATADRHKPEKKGRYTREDFQYDEEKDVYICPNGKELRLDNRRTNIRNYVLRKYASRQRDCTDCKLREKCLRKKETKRRYLLIPLEKQERNFSKEMIKKIDSDEGREIYSERMKIVKLFLQTSVYKKGWIILHCAGK
ncbi:MAG: transposase, partial [Candidatus Cloacimonetes bacterium]|nr:transposase [Candidatus Cloacimonadota bacterium]